MYKVFSSLSVQESPTHNVCHSFKICSVAYPPSSQLGGHVCLCNCISQTSFFPALLTIVVVTSRGVGSDVCLPISSANYFTLPVLCWKQCRLLRVLGHRYKKKQTSQTCWKFSFDHKHNSNLLQVKILSFFWFWFVFWEDLTKQRFWGFSLPLVFRCADFQRSPR